MVKFISVLLASLFVVSLTAVAANKVVVVPSGDDFITIAIPIPEPEPEPEPEPVVTNPVFLDQALGKPVIWNRGWDTNIGNRTKLDTGVNLSFTGISRADFGCNQAIRYSPGPNIVSWGLQRAFTTSFRIYSKAVILIDKGTHYEGGPFEWTLNGQRSVTLHNIYFSNNTPGWLGRWFPPSAGQKVAFFLMSDDERLSSNPMFFTWPASASFKYC